MRAQAHGKGRAVGGNGAARHGSRWRRVAARPRRRLTRRERSTARPSLATAMTTSRRGRALQRHWKGVWMNPGPARRIAEVAARLLQSPRDGQPRHHTRRRRASRDYPAHRRTPPDGRRRGGAAPPAGTGAGRPLSPPLAHVSGCWHRCPGNAHTAVVRPPDAAGWPAGGGGRANSAARPRWRCKTGHWCQRLPLPVTVMASLAPWVPCREREGWLCDASRTRR